MKEAVIITLPYPPTGNHAVKHTRQGRHYVTSEAKSYYETVTYLVRCANACAMLDGDLTVECDIYPPDRRRRDMDNAWKVLSDACTKAGVWLDDTQINRLVLERQEPVKDGRVLLRVLQSGEKSVR